MDIDTDKCYYFAAEQRLNWFEAARFCHNLCADCFLAEIDDKLSWEILKEYNSDVLGQPEHIWIGANDVRSVNFTFMSNPDSLKSIFALRLNQTFWLNFFEFSRYFFPV